MLTFCVEPDAEGHHAWCPELPGCHTHGATRIHALEMLKEAVLLYVEDMLDERLEEESNKNDCTSAPA